MAKYKDLGDEQEDERIRQIGHAALQGHKVAFITDSDPGKMDRYIQKLLKRFPGLEIVNRLDGPVKNTVTATCQLRKDRN